MKYTKAPVSEVIIGITFAKSILDMDAIFAAQNALANEYPNTEIRPPLADMSLVEFRLSTEVDPNATGPFLLRMRTADKKWLCQLQGNKLYINWIRPDEEKVGNYVGFTKVLNQFLSVCRQVGIELDDNVSSGVKYFEATYHDRIEWQQYIGSISDLSAIMNVAAPRIGITEELNNVFSRYTYHLPELKGHGVLSINTETSPQSIQLLKLESTIRGFLPDVSLSDWMHKANLMQVQCFENLFTKDTLDSWR